MTVTTLNVGLDLGSDTFKVAYAYKVGSKVSFGKLMKDGFVTQVALPSVAFFDDTEGKWVYADKVERSSEKSFVKVVKIKWLLELLNTARTKTITQSNAEYYNFNNQFPKFYFPLKRELSESMAEMEKADMTFSVEYYTPRRVLEEYFSYCADMVVEAIASLSQSVGVEFDSVRYSIVHHSKMSKAYRDELTRLLERAFKQKAFKIVSSTKALAMYAYFRKAIKKNDNILVFDMGEQITSVGKATLNDFGHLVVDGQDGHNLPIKLGGNDFDDCISKYLEGAIDRRETVGTPSYGQDGHIAEKGLHSKRYLFAKDIKKAKMILSMAFDGESVFSGGVPIAISRDLYIQRSLKHAEFGKTVGTTRTYEKKRKKADKSVADRIADYVVEELSRPVNLDVNKVVFSGGLTETYELIPFLTKALKSFKGVEIITFDDGKNVSDGHTIRSFEDSTYAASVGGAIVALEDYDVSTVVSLSYATYTTAHGDVNKFNLAIYLDKGTDLSKINEKVKFFGRPWVSSNEVTELPSEQFSTVLSTRDVENRKYADKLIGQYGLNSDGEVTLEIGQRVGSTELREKRARAEKYIGLKNVGGNDCKIIFFCKGKQVRLLQSIAIDEGVYIDTEDGTATPGLRIFHHKDYAYARVRYLNTYGSPEEVVSVDRIEPCYKGMHAFKTESDD